MSVLEKYNIIPGFTLQSISDNGLGTIFKFVSKYDKGLIMTLTTKDFMSYIEELKDSVFVREVRAEFADNKANKEPEQIISDKYKTRFFIEFLQEFGLEDKFNGCKTEDERYDIYALYTRVGLSKVHPSEYFKKGENSADSGVFTSKPKNKDNATFTKKPKIKQTDVYKIKIENDVLLESYDKGEILMGIQKLPQSIIKLLNNRGYKVRIVPIKELNYDIAGQWNSSNKTIKIAFDCNNDKCDVLLHELGHMIDYERQKSYISNSTEFIKIYEQEKTHFAYQSPDMYEYFKKNSQEFFAESFREYISEPYNLKSLAPKTYDFIENYIKSL